MSAGYPTNLDREKAAALQDIAASLGVKPHGEMGGIHASGQGWIEMRAEYLAAILAAVPSPVPEPLLLPNRRKNDN